MYKLTKIAKINPTRNYQPYGTKVFNRGMTSWPNLRDLESLKDLCEIGDHKRIADLLGIEGRRKQGPLLNSLQNQEGMRNDTFPSDTGAYVSLPRPTMP